MTLDGQSVLSGTVGDSALSGNVALLNRNPQTFTGQNNFSGNIVLTDPTKTIQFPNTAGANTAMITMFTSGGANADRMVIAHSPLFQNYGLRYVDTFDRFEFIGASSLVLSVDLGSLRVGVGRVAAANRLEVEGDASKTVAGSWLANSDARIKKDIRPLTNALDVINRIRPVAFRYTDEYRREHPSIGDTEYFNVIAQEFAEAFPGSVKSSGEKLPNGDEILQVDTYPATIHSIAAIQELGQRLNEKDQRISELEKRNDNLERRLAALETLITRARSAANER